MYVRRIVFGQATESIMRARENKLALSDRNRDDELHGLAVGRSGEADLLPTVSSRYRLENYRRPNLSHKRQSRSLLIVLIALNHYWIFERKGEGHVNRKPKICTLIR